MRFRPEREFGGFDRDKSRDERTEKSNDNAEFVTEVIKKGKLRADERSDEIQNCWNASSL